MEQRSNAIKDFLQSPKGLTAIVICIAVLLAVYLLLSSQTTLVTGTVTNITPTVTVSAQNRNIQQTTPYPTTNPALKTSQLSFEKQGSWVNVMLDTGSTPTSGVQLSLSYDPSVLKNVTVEPGSFFTNPTVLQNNVDQTKGTISFVIVIPPGEQQKRGKGTIATISYQIPPGTSTSINFLPNTKVTSEGINDSVLKTTTSVSLP